MGATTVSHAKNILIHNTKENKLKIANMQMDYISFGRGPKSLIRIQGLNKKVYESLRKDKFY